jgi:hypothetical protein
MTPTRAGEYARNVPGGTYEQEIRALEQRHRPDARSVAPYLLRTARVGLAKASAEAEAHADALDRLEPPSEAAEAHREYSAALRAVARDARQLAERSRWRSGRSVLNDLRALPSFQKMVATRQRLLDLAGR